MVRAAGAREVHVRISCPPTISPCFYGVDTPRRSELIAATHTLEEITQVPRRRQRRATSSLEGLLSAVGTERAARTARSCYTGVYPVAFPRDEASYLQLALKLDNDGRRRSARDRGTIRVRACVSCVGVQAAAPGAGARPQRVPPAQLQAAIDKLGDLDYATRTGAARTVRRTPGAQAVPALLQAAVESTPTATCATARWCCLTGFNDPRTTDAMRESLASPNDRLRTVAYSFFEHHPGSAR